MKTKLLEALSCFLLFCLPLQAQQNQLLPIGVFDSGTGGLTILEAILNLDEFNNITGAPGKDGKLDFYHESFQYLADQANMPYGNYAAVQKTDLLKEHILKNMQFFLSTQFDLPQNRLFLPQDKPRVKMIVIACNTATAYALEDIQHSAAIKMNKIPVIGVIDAGAKAALIYQRNHPGTIGVFATVGTVASDGYPRTLRQMAKQMHIQTPEIVSQGGYGIAESIDRDINYYSDTATHLRANYLGPSLHHTKYPIDTLLLDAYQFDSTSNFLVCERMEDGTCKEIQINAPANYVRYHLVHLLENMRKQQNIAPLNTLILGCTHYPYLKDTIQLVLSQLYDFKRQGKYIYRHLLASHVKLIDPGVETAKTAYVLLRKHKLAQTFTTKNRHQFFISIPHSQLPDSVLGADGWFTYAYKYGRKAGANQTYVHYVPFDKNNIVAATYARFQQALPKVYQLLKSSLTGLPE